MTCAHRRFKLKRMAFCRSVYITHFREHPQLTGSHGKRFPGTNASNLLFRLLNEPGN